jgi:recombinational DNA repair protein RecR
MEHTLARIFGQIHKHKVCLACGCINWYENEYCHNCANPTFDSRKETVLKWCEDEFDYWTKQEKYSESEADNVLIEV